jgi:hypothetical protein
MGRALEPLGLSSAHVLAPEGEPTAFGRLLHRYVQHRAITLNTHVEPRLMSLERSRETYEMVRTSFTPNWPVPFNKQKGEKKGQAYFTGIVNNLVEANIGQMECDYNPRRLTTFTSGRKPLRTFARQVDGAFPGVVNPIALWGLKEYYHTTSFGSRVAGGVYETLLDGLEIEELREHEQIGVKHYLMVDGYLTWWGMGRSFLCRIVDMLHMGYVDEVLFGYEVVEELPRVVQEWVAIARSQELAQRAEDG